MSLEQRGTVFCRADSIQGILREAPTTLPPCSSIKFLQYRRYTGSKGNMRIVPLARTASYREESGPVRCSTHNGVRSRQHLLALVTTERV